MAKTKHTARRALTATQLPPATVGYPCPFCVKSCSRKPALKRHCGLVHNKTIDGQPIDAGERAKFVAYNAKRTRPTTSTVPKPATSPIPRPATVTTATVSPSPRLPASRSQLEEDLALSNSDESDVQATPDETAKQVTPDKPATPPSQPRRSPRHRSSTRSVSPRPSQSPASATPQPTTSGETSRTKQRTPKDHACKRKRTQPMMVTGPAKSVKIGQLQKQVPIPVAVPRPSRAEPSRRRVELNPSTLARRVRNETAKSSTEIVDELATTYSYTAEERRAKVNIVRSMRAARRDFCMEIRRHFPLYPTPQAKDDFLKWLDTRVQAEEENDSDEFL